MDAEKVRASIHIKYSLKNIELIENFEKKQKYKINNLTFFYSTTSATKNGASGSQQ
jgi:hypothetical protein